MKEVEAMQDEITITDMLKAAKDELGLGDTKDTGKKLAIGGMVTIAVGGALMMLGKILMEND